jgi:hypothetical protein
MGKIRNECTQRDRSFQLGSYDVYGPYYCKKQHVDYTFLRAHVYRSCQEEDKKENFFTLYNAIKKITHIKMSSRQDRKCMIYDITRYLSVI